MANMQVQLPLAINIPTQHQRLLNEVREAKDRILSLDPVRRTLTTLYWSVLKNFLMQCNSSHV
jgi:hypothetical protein